MMKEHEKVAKEHEKIAQEHMKISRIYVRGCEGNGKGKGQSYKYITVDGDSITARVEFEGDSGIVIVNGKTFAIPPVPPMPPMNGILPPFPPMPDFEEFDFDDFGGKMNMTVEEDKEKGTKRIIIELDRSEEKTPGAPELKKEKKKMSNKGPEELMPGSSSSLKIYPNPSSGVFNLAFEIKQKGDISVRITDIAGREVYKENFTDTNGGYYHHSFDMRDKPDGLYIITVEQGGTQEVIRFVKES